MIIFSKSFVDVPCVVKQITAMQQNIKSWLLMFSGYYYGKRQLPFFNNPVRSFFCKLRACVSSTRPFHMNIKGLFSVGFQVPDLFHVNIRGLFSVSFVHAFRAHNF